jgi:hypothetical protein
MVDDIPVGGAMSAEVPIGQEAAVQAERRKSGRVVILVPVEIQWQTPEGEIVSRSGLARNVDVHGALVQMKAFGHQKTCINPTRCRCGHLAGRHFPVLNTNLDLKNSITGDSVGARVIHVGRAADGTPGTIGIQLLAPTDTFWGLTFQLQRTLIQLQEIEDSFQSRESQIDFRVRRNLREAVEYLRVVGSAVQQWQDLRAQGKDAYSVLELLSNARVDRATHLLRELTSDIDASELTEDREAFTNLAQAVERLYERMTRGPVMAREAP